MMGKRRTDAAIALIAIACACGGSNGGPTQSSGCEVVVAQISPATASVAVGDSANLFVGYSTAAICATHPSVAWSSNNAQALSLAPDGEAVYVIGRAAVSQPVTVTAIVGGVAAHAQVTVTPRPAIRLTPQSLAFTAIQNQPTLPDSQTVAITNSGGGTLGRVGPDATVYGPGASGWLFIKKNVLTSVAPYSLIIQPRNTALSPGTYTATVPVSSPDASNSPQNLTVTITITGGSLAPTISGLTVTLVSANGCSSGGTTGNSFRATLSFTDPSGNALTGTLLESYVFHPTNFSGSLSVPVPSSQATVSNGTITLQGLCIVFGTNTSMDFTLTLTNATGLISNSISASISKPAGGAGIGRP